MARITLATPLITIPGIGTKFLSHLAKLNIATVHDLLWHFPVRYEDFSQIVPINELEVGQQATVSAIIDKIDVRHSFRRHMAIVEAHVHDDTGRLRLIWFNQPYLKTILQPGKHANFAGKVSLTERGLSMNHPTHELLGNHGPDHAALHTARLVPIYPETKGLTSKGLRFLIQPILESLTAPIEYLPAGLLEKNGLAELREALANIHTPETLEDAIRARRRFAFEDIFLLQLFNFQQKLKLAREKAPALPTDMPQLKAIIAALPFTLTPSQKTSLWEIIKDIEKPRPMNRLLQGDVGSGKTVVAILAGIIAAANDYQTAFMAPTEVLARQHFETIKKLLGHIDNGETGGMLAKAVPIAFVAAGGARLFYGDGLESEIKKPQLNSKIKSGEVRIIVGTHALIQKSVEFAKLGLIVIDEQHRFGVRQRAMLAKHKTKALVPHLLSMSATPIPRTLMLTIFGDLDISTITHLPAGRKKIVTEIIPPTGRQLAYDFIRHHIREGRQAFVVCPRIEAAATGDEKNSAKKMVPYEYSFYHQDPALEVASVKQEYEKLSQTIFPELRVAMLHGQMKAKEKETVMREFKEGLWDILVSTSVIEVGVDVPNATIMMIEGAERFGLAQLYQFRGRVGRGEHQSHCMLFTQSETKTTTARLQALLQAKNGFELAEWDLKIRGPGQFLGEAQTGIPDLAMRSLQDVDLIKSAREAAMAVMKTDQQLTRHPMLKEKVSEFKQELHLE